MFGAADMVRRELDLAIEKKYTHNMVYNPDLRFMYYVAKYKKLFVKLREEYEEHGYISLCDTVYKLKNKPPFRHWDHSTFVVVVRTMFDKGWGAEE